MVAEQADLDLVDGHAICLCRRHHAYAITCVINTHPMCPFVGQQGSKLADVEAAPIPLYGGPPTPTNAGEVALLSQSLIEDPEVKGSWALSSIRLQCDDAPQWPQLDILIYLGPALRVFCNLSLQMRVAAGYASM